MDVKVLNYSLKGTGKMKYRHVRVLSPLLLLLSSSASGTGIMLPDMGFWGGMVFLGLYFGFYGIMYLALPLFVGIVIYKMIKKKIPDQRTHDQEHQ